MFWASQVALVVKNPLANAGRCNRSRFNPWLGRSPAEENDNPLQYSCLENPIDRAAWWAIGPGVTKSWTWLKWLSTQYNQSPQSFPRLSFSSSLSDGISVPPSISTSRVTAFLVLLWLISFHFTSSQVLLPSHLKRRFNHVTLFSERKESLSLCFSWWPPSLSWPHSPHY